MIRGALAEGEVDELNAAIDHHLSLDKMQPHASMAGGTANLFGDSNVHVKIAKRLNSLRSSAAQTSAADVVVQLGAAGFPPRDTERDAGGRPQLTDAEALRAALEAISLGGVPLTADEQLAAMEAAEPDERGNVRIGVGRTDVGGMLQWEHPWCDPFRRQLVNPAVRPYLQTLLGSGYRMDHMPHLMISDKGCDGHNLHGGGANRFSKGGFLEAYQYNDGKLFTGMVVVE